jgi:hypothetical protein
MQSKAREAVAEKSKAGPAMSVGRLVFTDRRIKLTQRQGEVRCKRDADPSVVLELKEGEFLRSIDFTLTLRSQLDQSRKTVDWNWFAIIETEVPAPRAKRPKKAKKARKR